MKIALISDVHEDIFNLKKAMKLIERLQVDEIFCLGDISGYTVPYYKYQHKRNASECLKIIKENCKYSVLGNHDIYAGKIIPKACHYLDFPENWYELDYKDRAPLAKDKIWLHEEDDLNTLYAASDIEYLKTIPEIQKIQIGGLDIMLSHYVFPNLSGLKQAFYHHHEHYFDHLVYMKENNCMLSFHGHSHGNGYSVVTKSSFHNYRTRRATLTHNALTTVGVPAIAKGIKKSGFCLFNTEDLSIRMVKI